MEPRTRGRTTGLRGMPRATKAVAIPPWTGATRICTGAADHPGVEGPRVWVLVEPRTTVGRGGHGATDGDPRTHKGRGPTRGPHRAAAGVDPRWSC